MSEIPNHQSAESTRNDPRPTTTHPFTLAKLKSTSTAPTSNLAKSVLDLAYGTGLVTILAKQQVGETGNVIGIDISQGMLDVARAKTKQLGLDITLFEHNITDLDELRLDMNIGPELLKPTTGRLLTDVMIERNVIAPGILVKIGPKVGRELMWNGRWVKSEDSLKQLFVDAGLVVEEVYNSEVYETREYTDEEGPELFEKTVTNPMFRVFGEQEVKERAKELFVEEFRALAGEDGLVHEEIRFNIEIARKEDHRW